MDQLLAFDILSTRPGTSGRARLDFCSAGLRFAASAVTLLFVPLVTKDVTEFEDMCPVFGQSEAQLVRLDKTDLLRTRI